jgi:hypothetical protein
MTGRILVIGGDAAGMSAAAQARRIAGDAVEIGIEVRTGTAVTGFETGPG